MLDDEYYGAADQTPKEKCCIELLETFLWNGKALLKLCTAHEKTWMGTEKKFSVLHKYQNQMELPGVISWMTGSM